MYWFVIAHYYLLDVPFLSKSGNIFEWKLTISINKYLIRKYWGYYYEILRRVRISNGAITNHVSFLLIEWNLHALKFYLNIFKVKFTCIWLSIWNYRQMSWIYQNIKAYNFNISLTESDIFNNESAPIKKNSSNRCVPNFVYRFVSRVTWSLD